VIEQLHEVIQEIEHQWCAKRLLVVGDMLLDKYIRGDVRRISPEAPHLAAGEVVGKVGTVPIEKHELLAALSPQIALHAADKVISRDEWQFESQYGRELASEWFSRMAVSICCMSAVFR
jgi:bifunctional ADP-heptose synthase (sugar kinase/adenylyltransferase)